MKKKYNVVFTYSFQVPAESEDEAEELAYKYFEEDMPRLNEFGVIVEKI